MSDILQEILKKNLNKKIILFLKNNFRYNCTILNLDTTYVKIRDFKGITVLNISDIASVQESDR